MPFPIGTVDNQFHNGNPATNTPGTVVDAEWLNAVQAAILALAAAAKTVYATYVITNSDGKIIFDSTDGAFVATLPPTSGLVAGKCFYLKAKRGGSGISVVAADGKTIDGELQIDLAPGDRMLVCYEGEAAGGNWETF
jgi:hypothetical protein